MENKLISHPTTDSTRYFIRKTTDRIVLDEQVHNGLTNIPVHIYKINEPEVNELDDDINIGDAVYHDGSEFECGIYIVSNATTDGWSVRKRHQTKIHRESTVNIVKILKSTDQILKHSHGVPMLHKARILQYFNQHNYGDTNIRWKMLHQGVPAIKEVVGTMQGEYVKINIDFKTPLHTGINRYGKHRVIRNIFPIPENKIMCFHGEGDEQVICESQENEENLVVLLDVNDYGSTKYQPTVIELLNTAHLDYTALGVTQKRECDIFCWIKNHFDNQEEQIEKARLMLIDNMY